jgi:hypothetical protein
VHCATNADGSLEIGFHYWLGFDNVSATSSFCFCGNSFITRINAESTRQMLLEATKGHCRPKAPKANHSAKPKTVSVYIPVEMSLVWRDRRIFQACGAKLAVETHAAT